MTRGVYFLQCLQMVGSVLILEPDCKQIQTAWSSLLPVGCYTDLNPEEGPGKSRGVCFLQVLQLVCLVLILEPDRQLG